MTTNEMPDPILRMLSRLPPAATPIAVDQRVRSRCHVALEKHRCRAQRSAPAIFPSAVITAALAMTAGIYAAAAVLEALRLAGMR